MVYDNAGDRATLTASTTAGSLAVTNLQTYPKAQVHRSTATSVTYTATWATSEFIGCAALPFCNYTPAATIRVRGYAEVADVIAAVDTGIIDACPYAAVGILDWGYEPLGVNAASRGGDVYAIAWFAITPVKKIVIDIVDTLNDSGYLQAGRLVLGNYWSPSYSATIGASVTIEDTSEHYRNDAGGLLTDVGTMHRKLDINLDVLTPDDRARFIRILRGNGKALPILLSLYPEDTDTELEQVHQVYGKISNMSSVTTSSWNVYSAPCEIEEI